MGVLITGILVEKDKVSTITISIVELTTKINQLDFEWFYGKSFTYV